MLTVLLATFLILWYLSRRVVNNRRPNPGSLPFPPGPPPKWIVGNFAEMPTPINFKSLWNWKNEFGDLTFFQAFGQSILILNSVKAATELLEKRGAKYAHRPPLVVAGELMGLDQGIAMMDYNPRQRLYRRLAHRVFNSEAIKRYEPMLQKHTLLMLRDLLDKPDDFDDAIRLTSARNILSISYGIDIPSVDSEHIVSAEKTMSVIEEAIEPGAFLADFLPFMKHIPSWFPFASFKRFANMGRKQIDEFMALPFDFVKSEIAKGTAPPSLIADILLEKDPLLERLEKAERDKTIMLLFGGLYGAATATSTATVQIFFMLMALHPDKQLIAQAEIDRVTEGHRLPSFSDRERMPYMTALMKEILRWHAVVPLGLPRQTQTDDEYNGYYIPANTIVLYNLWVMGKTEGPSSNLEDFSPERYMGGNEVIDPYSFVFGFGRRVCPGRFLADNALFSIFSSILACFNIAKKRLDNGNLGGAASEVPIRPEFTRHLISYPEPFVCDIRPRSAQTLAILEDALAASSGEANGHTRVA